MLWDLVQGLTYDSNMFVWAVPVLIYPGWIVRLLAAVLHVLVVRSCVLVVFCCWQTVVKAEHNGGERKTGEQQYLSRS